MKSILNSFLLIFTIFIISCNPTGSSFSPNPEPVIPAEISIGTGMFIFTMNDIDFEVFYHVPSSYTTSSKVVFAMHGGGRDAEGVRNYMINISNQYNFIVVAPKVSSSDFSLGDGYILGNVYVDGDNPSTNTLKNENEWSFSIIEPIFDSINISLSLINEKYNLFGYSAGGQFVQRFLLFKPNARIDKVVVGAAGWYTVPDYSTPFPYGLNNSILMSTNINSLLMKNLFIQVGALDNDPNSFNLRHNEYADAQGLNRVTRAIYFYNFAQSIGESNNYNFNWSLHILPEIGHNFGPLAENACDLMFN